MNWKPIIAICLVFVGCCSNVIFLELLVKYDPGSGNLITFLQFLFIAIEGLIFTTKLGTQKRYINFRDYFILVVMFFVSSVCNNYAFDFNIPMPLHMIFRAGSLIANMIMGIIILNKNYEFSKFLSVFLITAGIILCTIVSGSEVKDTSNPDLKKFDDGSEAAANQSSVLFYWILGIMLLTLALFISARMGIYQEYLFSRYGKHSREALFFTHFLPLPFFAIVYSNLWQHILIANASPPTEFLGHNLPIMWLHLMGNILTQYVCIGSVYVLTTECSSLTVTLVVTLRKFVSLIFSIVHFQNPFTIYHWMGTIMVFVGTMIFTEIVPSIVAALGLQKQTGGKKKKPDGSISARKKIE